MASILVSHIDLNITEEGHARVHYDDGHYQDLLPADVFDKRPKLSLLQRLTTWASANPVKVAALSGALAGAIPEPVRKLIVTFLS